MTFKFGPCRLDLARRELLRDGAPQHLSPKAFDVLRLLIAARPRVVTKAELMDAVWQDAFVSEVNLPVIVGEIRKAIGDPSRDARWLLTHHSVGYSFAADVFEAKPGPRVSPRGTGMALLLAERRIELLQGESVVGRDPSADIVIVHGSISRRHARLTVTRGGVVVEDLDSKNGTRVGADRVSGPTPLPVGSVVVFGSVEAILVAENSQEASTMTLMIAR